MDWALGVVLGGAGGAVLLSWWYFRHYAVARPPLGVINGADVIFMLAATIAVPYLYLLLPLWLAGGLLAVGYVSILYAVAEPVLRARWAIWLVALTPLAADVGAAHLFGPASPRFFAVNNVLLVAVAVGVANLWAQSGLKARDLAVLAAGLAVYDLVATSFLPLMTDLIERLATVPFAPMLAWPAGGAGRWLGVGLGDLLLAAVCPLVLRRGFGRRAGVAALATSLVALGGLLVLVASGLVQGTLPAMVVLGPLMVLQYVFWTRRRGPERPTWQYLQAEPVRRARTPHPTPAPDVLLPDSIGQHRATDRWIGT